MKASDITYKQSKDIMRMLEDGYTVSDIGKKIGASPTTVGNYITKLLAAKPHTGVHSDLYKYRDNLRIFLAQNRSDEYPSKGVINRLTASQRVRICREIERLNAFLRNH